MIVLDTDVIAEFTRPDPAPKVIKWVDQLGSKQIFVTSVTIGELLYDLARLPTGRRKAALDQRLNTVLTTFFGGQSLGFTGKAATAYADIVATRERLGRRIRHADAQIAAICRVNGADLATGNVEDFEETGVPVIDPWSV